MSLKQIIWSALSLGSVLLLLFAVIGTGLLLVLLAALWSAQPAPAIPSHEPTTVGRAIAQQRPFHLPLTPGKG